MSWAGRSASALALAAVALAAQPAAAEPQVGAVGQREYQGATGTRVSGEARNLVYDESVYADERVDTTPTGATNLVFLDQTNLYIGARSSVVLDKFVYDPASHQGDVAISFAKGAFRFVTGEIKNKQNVTLRTPTASMVIRGTELWLYILSDGTTEVDVTSGGVDLFVCDKPNAVPVDAGQSFTVSSSCEGTRGQARDRAELGEPIPRMPREYAALENIETAAGDETSGTPPPPDWVRGRNSDHENDADRGRNRD
ncbi:MAG TPA: FecR domain-containing protein [Candidatus Acidoferrum sp.]|nr:FecR domain-containing protein [Candidatus Acidoferrum sp.]